MKSKTLVVLLAVIPLLLFCSSFYLKSKITPYYLSLDQNPDNEYPYLLNSLNIIELRPPEHTDHPGTTLQILGAMIITFKWLSTSIFGTFTPIVDSVLREPEKYLNIMNILLNMLIGFALYWVGFRVFQSSKRVLPAIILQFTMLLFLQIQESLTKVSTEPLLLFAGLILILILIPFIFENKDSLPDLHQHKKIAILLGVSLGFGIATKIIFLSLAVLIFLFETSKERRTAAAAAFLAFFIFTIPIIPNYPKMAKWFGALLIHKDHYGSGGYGLPAFNSLIKNFFDLVSEEPFLFISFAFYVLISIYIYTRTAPLRLKSTNPDRIQRLLWLGCLIIAVQIAITIKHPGARYMLPAMVITSLLNSVIIFQCEMKEKLFPLARLIVSSALFIFLGTGLVLNFFKTQVWIKEIELSRVSEEKLHTKIKEFDNCAKIQYYRSPLLEYALAFGNDFAGRRYNHELALIYPDALYYDMWHDSFYSFKGPMNKAEIQDRLANGTCMIMIGYPFTGSHLSYLHNLDLKLIAAESNGAVYQFNGFKN